MTNENLCRGLRITSVPRYMKVTQKRDPSCGAVGHIVVTYKIFRLRVDLPRSGHSNARRLIKPLVSSEVVMFFHISHASHLRLCLRDAITTVLLDITTTAMAAETENYSLTFSILVVVKNAGVPIYVNQGTSEDLRHLDTQPRVRRSRFTCNCQTVIQSCPSRLQVQDGCKLYSQS